MAYGLKTRDTSGNAQRTNQRITVYDHPSEKLFMTREGRVIRKPIMIHIPADPGAAMNWLKNRQPEIWRGKQQIEFSRETVVTMNLNGGDAGSNEIDEVESDNESEIDE